jgi:predicted component of type VI protein secretion system
MARTLCLTHMSGPEDGLTLDLHVADDAPEVTFGRLESCTVTLPHDRSASRRHARLVWRDAGWWLEDLGSANGSFVGEFAQAVRVTQPVRLAFGCVFCVGQSRFRLDAPKEAEAWQRKAGSMTRSS